MITLNYKQFGEHGPNLIILHGLFGSLDNWQTLAKGFAQHFQVYIIDQRNHGKSPHTDDFDYKILSNDLHDFIQIHQLHNNYILGHSMGGKTAMQFAFDYPEKLEKLIVADIAPKAYSSHHDEILAVLNNFPINEITSRKQAEEIMEKQLNDFGVRQFLLKNLDRITDSKYQWRMNLPILTQKYNNIVAEIKTSKSFNKPTLFIRGEKSKYIEDADTVTIQKIFPNAIFKSILNVGHWVHAEAPELFYKYVVDFLAIQ